MGTRRRSPRPQPLLISEAVPGAGGARRSRSCRGILPRSWIAAREQADAARAEQDAADRAATEAAQREELARWNSEDDLAAEAGDAADDTAASDSGEELVRE